MTHSTWRWVSVPEASRYPDTVTSMRATIVRRTAAVLAASAAVVAVAGPASADVPEGWAQPYHPSGLHSLLIFVGIPALLFLLITLAVYLPSMLRGGRGRPGGSGVEDQWFGGPRKGTAELPAPDNEESKAGGASGRW